MRSRIVLWCYGRDNGAEWSYDAGVNRVFLCNYCVTTGEERTIAGEERTITGRSYHGIEDDAFGVVVHAFITNLDNGKLLCMTRKGLKDDIS